MLSQDEVSRQSKATHTGIDIIYKKNKTVNQDEREREEDKAKDRHIDRKVDKGDRDMIQESKKERQRKQDKRGERQDNQHLQTDMAITYQYNAITGSPLPLFLVPHLTL